MTDEEIMAKLSKINFCLLTHDLHFEYGFE